MVRKVFSAALLAVFAVQSVFAAPPAVVFDRDTGEIVVEGVLEDARNKTTMLEITDSDGNVVFMDMAEADAENRYRYVAELDTTKPTENLYFGTITQYGAEQPMEPVDIPYYTADEVQGFIAAVNAADRDDIQTVLEGLRDELGLDFTLYDAYKAAGKDLSPIFNNLSSAPDFRTVAEINTVFSGSLIAIELNCAAADEVAEILNKHADFLALDSQPDAANIYDTFLALPAGRQQEVYGKMAGRSLNTLDDIYYAFNSAVITTAVKAASNWTQVRDLTNDNRDVLADIRFSRLEDLDDASQVYFAVAGQPYDDIDDYIKALNAAIDAQYAAENSGSGTGGGGGSSGGGGGRRPSSGGGSGGSNITSVTPPAQMPEETEPEMPFDDLEDVAWAVDAIAYLKDKNIINGVDDTHFAPNDLITREEFTKLLVLATEFYSPDAEVDLTDVSPDHWSYLYIASAYDFGLTSGVSETEFGMGQNITRQDMATMAYRAMQAAGKRIEDGEADFTDSAQIAGYAAAAVGAMQKAGIIGGMGDGSFAPAGFATRAQAAKIIYEIYIK